jgi:Recombination endonuclease VII
VNHICVDCIVEQPKTVRKIVSGKTVLTFRCATHTREKKARDKMKARFAHVARTYGLTPEQYIALLEYQQYLCAVCRIANGKTKALAVDHDHALAKLHPHDVKKACVECVRGLLCGPCNQHVIGRLGLTQLQNAVSYKEEPPFVRMRRLGLVPG